MLAHQQLGARKMSSLAATQADGYYRPDLRHLSNHRGSSQFARTGKIRFELPHGAKCVACGDYYGRGTRFNASKEHVGNYFTSKIWEFAFGCKNCAEILKVRTDPQTRDFVFAGSLRRKAGSQSSGAGADSVGGGGGGGGGSEEDSSTAFYVKGRNTRGYGGKSRGRQRRGLDAMGQLEHDQEQAQVRSRDSSTLVLLQKMARRNYGEDVASNSRLRRTLRSSRHVQERLLDKGKRLGIGGALAPATEDDTARARAAMGREQQRRHHGKRSRGRAMQSASDTMSSSSSRSSSKHKRRRMASVKKESIFGNQGRAGALARKVDAAFKRVPRSSRLVMKAMGGK